jgi:ribosomal protein S18 acetylase RimI-like enzyme
VRVRGWAWSGEGAITRVDLAIDGGDNWVPATLGTPTSSYAWTPWHVDITLPRDGRFVLRSRAADSTGAVQPDAIVWNRLGYGNNAIRHCLIDVGARMHGDEHVVSTPQIRRATVADAAAIAEFGARVFAHTFAPDNTPQDLAAYLATAFGEAIQRREIEHSQNEYLLVEIAGVLSAIALVEHGATDAAVTGEAPVRIERFYVDHDFHGRGIAPQLMDACLDTARAMGGKTLWLGVWEQNARAIRFYEKHGFRDVGTQVFMMGSDAQTDRVLARSV